MNERIRVSAEVFGLTIAMSTMVTELVVPLRGSKLRAASRREVRAVPTLALHS
ncbi:MAG: hypothetical protein V7L20_20045 [Nostoc sp.]|uniref:hypothetical protein n=1 Tax=Nostoc sp. TaxID=1180 RepID=UPI002FFC1D30